MSNTPLFARVDDELEFFLEFSPEQNAVRPGMKPLDDILLVGGRFLGAFPDGKGLTRDDPAESLIAADCVHLRNILAIANQFNLAAHKDTAVRVCNREYGCDVLSLDPQSAKTQFMAFAVLRFDPSTIRHDQGLVAQSPLAHKKELWHEVLCRSEADVVLNISGESAWHLNALFNKPPYKQHEGILNTESAGFVGYRHSAFLRLS